MTSQSYAEAMAKTIMKRHPKASDYPYKSWSYPQGFVLWGFIRLHEQTKRQAYLDYVLDYCDEQVEPDGSIPRFSGVSLDDIMTGSVLVYAYQKTGQKRYEKACRKVRSAFTDYPRNRDGGFWHMRHLPHEMWIDGLFMGLMFLVRYGAFIDEQDACFEETVKQLGVGFDRCEKDGSGLLYHAYSEDRKPSWAHPITGKSSQVWSEGLGWYALILADVLQLLPQSHAGYARLCQQMTKLLDGLCCVQDPSCGLWYQVVDKPGWPRNFHDSSGSAMFVYALQKASLLHIGDAKRYAQSAASGFAGLKAKITIDLEGHLDVHDACNGLCVQDHYDAYVDYTKTVNGQEAIAAFFWAAQIMEHGLTKEGDGAS